MLTIGITGGIGSGKSHICRFLEDLKYPVYSSDEAAKIIVSTNLEIRKKIINLLGCNAYKGAFYDTSYVSQLVFNEPKLLEELNNIIHPIVNLFFRSFVNEQKLTNSNIVFKESALIIETGDYKNLDYTILVKSPLKIRRERVMQRQRMTIDKFKQIVDLQLKDSIKLKYVDFVLSNNESKLFLSELLIYLQNCQSKLK